MSYQHPNESVLLPPGHWSPSVSSRSRISLSSSSDSKSSLVTIVDQRDISELQGSQDDPVSQSGTVSVTALTAGKSEPQPARRNEVFVEVPHVAASSADITPPITDAKLGNHYLPSDSLKSDASPLPDLKLQQEPSQEPPIALVSYYVRIKQGEHLWRKLADPEQRISISIDNVCANVYFYHAESTTPILQNPCWVRVGWLEASERPEISTDQLNLVNVRELSSRMETTREHGVLGTETTLYLCWGRNIVSVKYSLARQ